VCWLVGVLQPLLQTSQFTFYLAPRPAIKNVQLELKEEEEEVEGSTLLESMPSLQNYGGNLSRFFAAKL
jgi:hypothetical protein